MTEATRKARLERMSEMPCDGYIKPASVKRIRGTTAEVTCMCGVLTSVCLGQKASALSCHGCGSLVRLPDWSDGGDPSRRVESRTFWRDVLMAELRCALIDAGMEFGDLTIGDVMTMREEITFGADAMLFELFKIKYEGIDPEDKS